MKNKRISDSNLILFSVVLMTILTVVSLSFAYFTPTIINSANNYVNLNTINPYDYINITLSDKVEIVNSFPMNENTANIKLDPYTISIENSHTTLNAKYSIILESKTGNTINDQFISTSLGGIISSNPTYLNLTSGYSMGYVISEGIVTSGSTKNISFLTWINENATINDAANKKWEGKVKVVAILTDEQPSVNP